MIYLFGVAVYWLIGVVVLCRDWVDTFDEIDLATAFLNVCVFWLLWPVVALGWYFKPSEIIIWRKSGSKQQGGTK